MKTYKGHLTRQVVGDGWFVFGSNVEGRHGKGAAKTAFQIYGAEYGNPKGPQGRSYAIVTKDLRLRVHPSVSPANIITQIEQLYRFAQTKPDELFYVPYNTEANLSGYAPRDMAIMFAHAGPIPENIVFEETFAALVQKYGKSSTQSRQQSG